MVGLDAPAVTPLPPTVVKVETFIPLSDAATSECREPHFDPETIERDVDLQGVGMQWKHTSRCNAMKLCLIREIMRTGSALLPETAVEACRAKIWPENAKAQQPAP